MSEVDALVAAAAAQAGVGSSPAASASSEGYETSEGGFTGPSPVPEPPVEPAPPPDDGPQISGPEAPPSEGDTVIIGAPDEAVSHAPAIPAPVEEESEPERVPLAVLLKERDARQTAQRQLEQLEAEKAELARWRSEYEPVLDEARRVWPEMQQQAVQAGQFAQQVAQQQRLLDFYKAHLAKAKEEFGMEVDDEGFLQQAQMQAALDRVANIDQIVNTALAQQLNEREAMYSYRDEQLRQQRAQEAARRDRDQRFEQQFGELAKAAPGLSNFRNALRAEYEANPMVPLKDTASSLVTVLARERAKAAEQAATMPRTTGASSGARPQVGGSEDPATKYAGMGVREIIANRKEELRRAGRL